MAKRVLCVALLIAACIVLFASALAEEPTESFVDPTRNPNAPEYNVNAPQNLDDEQIVGYSFILMERSTGYVLRERRSTDLMYPASTTKILTALVALKYAELTDTFTVSKGAVDLPKDASVVPFRAGEEITMQDALYGLILKSGNDAANAIAEYISGDTRSFAELLNEEARLLGCKNTNFTNPHGLFDELHYTTAEDLAIIMNAGMNLPAFRALLGASEYTLSPTKQNPARTIFSLDDHLRPDKEAYRSWIIAGKTGFNNQAGYALVEAAEHDGVEFIAVVLKSGYYSRWPDTSRLFAYGFTQYKSVTPEQIYNGIDPAAAPGVETEKDKEKKEDSRIVVEIKGFDMLDEDLGRLTLDIRAVDPTRMVRITNLAPEIDAIIENFSAYTNLRWIRELRAPVEEGDVMGILTFFPDNRDGGEGPADYELVATRSIKARENAPPTLEEIERMALEDPSIFPPFSWDWVLPPVLLLLAALFLIRFLIRAFIKRRKGKKHVPSPQKRYFS